MGKILSSIILVSIVLISCADNGKKQAEFVAEINELHMLGDSMTTNIKTDMRTINSQISDMIDEGVKVDLLGSFVDAYKEKERKFKKCTTSWKEIYATVVSSATNQTFSDEEIDEMTTRAQTLNDSLRTLSSEMASIHSQAMGILKKTSEENSEDRPLE